MRVVELSRGMPILPKQGERGALKLDKQIVVDCIPEYEIGDVLAERKLWPHLRLGRVKQLGIGLEECLECLLTLGVGVEQRLEFGQQPGVFPARQRSRVDGGLGCGGLLTDDGASKQIGFGPKRRVFGLPTRKICARIDLDALLLATV